MAVHIAPRFGSVGSKEGLALHGFGDWLAEQVQHGGGIVHKAYELVSGAAGFAGGEMLPFFGEANDQRHVHTAIKQGTLMAGHAATVVAVEKYNRVLGEPVLLELLDNCPDLLVHCRDTIIKARQFAANQRCVRIIGRQGHLVRVMNRAWRQRALHLFLKPRIRPHHGAALVRGHQVKYTEERLRFFSALAPVCRSTTFIP